jgi:ribosome assembly protein SQT1
MVSTGGMDGRVRVWRRVKRDSKGGVEDWKNWEFLTTLETGSEITVCTKALASSFSCVLVLGTD